MALKQPSKFWWLRRLKYVAIFVRELTSVAILAYVLLYLLTLSQLESGSTALLSQFGTAPFLILSFLVLAFTLYHSITWFILLPKVQPFKLGSLTISGVPAVAINVLILVVASWLVAYLVFGIQAVTI